jgi:type II secretory pathway pseudopilin PulG
MLRRADEGGFTLVELAVAVSLMLFVSGALLVALDSGTRAERRASTRIDDEQAVRLVLDQFVRDVRNAGPQPGPLLPLLVTPPSPGPGSPSPDEIKLGYPNGDAVVWSYDASTHVLQRQLNGKASVSLTGLTNPAGSVFQVLAADGANMFADQFASAVDVTACGTTVVAAVTSRGHPPLAPFTETAHAPLNAPGIDRRGCP